jgi:hypothetical protein
MPKELQPKDLPEVSGGQTFDYSNPLPDMALPYPQFPTVPGEAPDPLGDGKKHYVQS